MEFKKLIGSLSLLLLVSACSTTPSVDSQAELDRAEILYLRGNFTWWDAEKDYLVERVEDQVYKTTVELVADGQYYEFKFADESWSIGVNCGYLDKAKDEVVAENQKVTANCFAKYEPFRFTPKQTGKYDFFIDFSASTENPKVWVLLSQDGLIDTVVDPIQKAISSF